MNYLHVALFFTNIIFTLTLGWYLITNLQWYSYKLKRVVLNHHKSWWHIAYFIVPIAAYYILNEYFIPIFYLIVMPGIIWWHRHLDKKVVSTWRVKRFFIILLFITMFIDILCTLNVTCKMYPVLIPLFITYVISLAVEAFLALVYKKQAKAKLNSLPKLTIVAITGSYGKTSIKNFTMQILSQKYKVYATPRSVNTVAGIVRDINESLPMDTEIYICEAGAREVYDIKIITDFLQPQIAVIGKVGEQHMEYFKTLQNIILTKLQIMRSPRLQKAFIHTSVTNEPHEKVTFFGDNISNENATLDATSFALHLDNGTIINLQTKILGAFQAINIDAAVLVANYLGLQNVDIVKAVTNLKPVEHRLQRIDAGGKIILDDGYNGNIDGMLEGIRLCSLHQGDKVIVTPGLVESTKELNKKLIEAINKVFDTVIVTGSLNADIFEELLHVKEKIILKDKTELQDILASKTKATDIILFANDAPNFI